MLCAGGSVFTTGHQLLDPKRAHRLQHLEAWLIIRAGDPTHQAVVEQCGEPIEQLDLHRGDRASGLLRPAADKDRQLAEECLLGRREQRIAPGNRVAHGLQARRGIARTIGQDHEALGEGGQQAGR